MFEGRKVDDGKRVVDRRLREDAVHGQSDPSKKVRTCESQQIVSNVKLYTGFKLHHISTAAAIYSKPLGSAEGELT